VGANWPNQGEVDILEGVTPNTATLHIGSNCSMSSSRAMTGFVPMMFTLFPVPSSRSIGQNYAAYRKRVVAASNFPTPRAMGFHSTTTKADGMIKVSPAVRVLAPTTGMLLSANRNIKVYFWPRGGSVPGQVEFVSSHDVIEPETWGMPAAAWSNDMCNFPEHFGPHNIIINLMFCGNWAGAAYPNSGCPDTCEGRWGYAT